MEKPLQAEVKRDNRIVSDWLLHCPERWQEYQEYLATVAVYPGQAISDDIRAKGQTSDPTGRTAVTMGEGFKWDVRWFDLVAEVERRIPEKQRVFLQVRREARHKYSNYMGRPAWVPYVQCKYPLVMAEQTGKDIELFYAAGKNTYTDWWNRLVEYAARVAIRRGLL